MFSISQNISFFTLDLLLFGDSNYIQPPACLPKASCTHSKTFGRGLDYRGAMLTGEINRSVSCWEIGSDRKRWVTGRMSRKGHFSAPPFFPLPGQHDLSRHPPSRALPPLLPGRQLTMDCLYKPK